METRCQQESFLFIGIIVLLGSYLLLTTLVASALDSRKSATALGLRGAIVALVTVVVPRASRTTFHDAALALWGATIWALVAHTSRELGALHCDGNNIVYRRVCFSGGTGYSELTWSHLLSAPMAGPY